MEDQKYDEMLDELRGLPPVEETPETPAEPETTDSNTQAAPETTETTETTIAPAETPTEPEWFENDEKLGITTQSTPEQPAAPDYSYLKDDPDFELFLAYKQSGKGLRDLVSELQVQDPSKMTDEQLLNVLFDEHSLTPEEREQELDNFSAKSILEKKQFLNQVRATVEQKNQEKMKGLRDSNQGNVTQQMQVAQKFESDVKTIASNIKGQSLFGVQITDEMSNDLIQEAMNFNVVRKDGSLDAEMIAEMVFVRKYLKDIVKTNITKAKNQGKKEVINEITNPSPESQGTPPTTSNSVENALNEYVSSKNN